MTVEVVTRLVQPIQGMLPTTGTAYKTGVSTSLMEIKLERLTQTQRMQGRRLRQEQMWAWGELKKYIFVDIEVKSNSHPLPQSFAVPIKVNECRLPSYCTIDVS